jgi:predicted nuclease of predicted toxin-antitoxin system
VKLLFDQNLSRRLVREVASAFPGSTHVTDAGLAEASDRDVWLHARDNGFAIVSKDVDFLHLGFLNSAPPKIIWIRTGNCTTSQLAGILRDAREKMRAFLENPDGVVLILGGETGLR